MVKQQLLMHDIEVLDSLIQGQQDPDIDALDELNEKKAALEQILDYEAEGAFVRSRIKYRIDGEKPTKLFFALESNNSMQKFVPQLITTKNIRRSIQVFIMGSKYTGFVDLSSFFYL